MDVAMVGAPKYKRVERDAYFTPAWCTEALAGYYQFESVWEPACGDGAIVRVLRADGVKVHASDIHDYGVGEPVADFFSTPLPDGVTDIVTNPPYKLAYEFIERALWLTEEPQGVVCMLLRNEYDCAGTRRNFFCRPFARKLVLTRRPQWFEEKKAAPRHNYAWFIWDWTHEGPATIAYRPR